MRIYSASVTSTAYKVTKIVTGVECDVCDKIIRVNDSKRRYFEVTTGHHDWGNDSCESIKTRDICPDCIDKYVSEYLRDCSDTGYIEIETCEVYADKESLVVDKPPIEGEVTKEGHDWY